MERAHTRIEDHAFIGANAVVHPGVRIGAGAIVGSGSVVLADVDAWSVNVGAPARAVGSRRSDVILSAATLGLGPGADGGA